MATFLYKTRGNSSPEHKPRVYFTCHPEDFSKHFEKICEDIFKTHDCAIFYTENLNEEIEEQYRESDLGQMNLFVIPVTFKLLSQPNRAMDFDFKYAKEKNIPVLPIMMEPELDILYSQNNKFSEMQYLNCYANDVTAISYEEKIRHYLDSVLISNKLAEKIRKAFDAYIFLSYRKKDRHYANDLMKKIHNNPEYRDIAIWFDEFITPGESFHENIERMLKDSKLFALLVTPNLLEYVNGEPNYIMAHEYPNAKNAGIEILPAEMVETDKAELGSKFNEIPECVNPVEEEAFRKRLALTLSKIAILENNNDPEHNYLIGLAYLDGIDVEKNTERGISLITAAAEANVLDAMETLMCMYYSGIYLPLDYSNAKFWAERIVKHRKDNLGEQDPNTLESLNVLANIHNNLGDYENALKLSKKTYDLRCEILGQEHIDTLSSLNNLACIYGSLCDYDNALKYSKKSYELRCKILGDEHPDTLLSLNNLACVYNQLGHLDNLKNEFDQQLFANSDYSLVPLYTKSDDFDYSTKALELFQKLHTINCVMYGDEHINTLKSLSNLAYAHKNIGDYKTALDLQDKSCALSCKILGENHPDSIKLLCNLANIYFDIGDQKNALEHLEKAFELRLMILGEKHPDTLHSAEDIAYIYDDLKDYKNAVNWYAKAYAISCRIHGELHPDTIDQLNYITDAYKRLGDHQKVLELDERRYLLNYIDLGADHFLTIMLGSSLESAYDQIDDNKMALELYEKSYALRSKFLGEDNPQTLGSKTRLDKLLEKLDF